MTWVEIAPAAALQASARISAEVDGYFIQVVRVADAYYAFEDRCTHDDAPFDDAPIEDTELVCPRHGARFCLKTGNALTPPAYEPLKIFNVRERDGRIELELPA